MSITPKQEKLLARLVETLNQIQPDGQFDKPPSPQDLARDLRMPYQAVHAVLNLGVQVGQIKVVEGEYLTVQKIEQMMAALGTLAKDGFLSTKGFREALGVSRTWSESIARYLLDTQHLYRVEGGYSWTKPEDDDED